MLHWKHSLPLTFALALSLGFVASVTPVADVHAQEEQENKFGKLKTRKTPAMREPVYKKLSEAQVAAEAENYVEAIKVLDGLRERGKLNSYEQAQMYNYYAFIYYSQEDYQNAIGAYRNVLAQPDIPLGMETATRYSLAQLYFVTENFDGAINELNAWFELAETPSAQAHVLLGQAYYSKQDYDGALPHIEKAIELTQEKGNQPKENWWLLLRAIYFEKQQYAKVAEILEYLVKHHPKKEYWLQLSGIYGELDQAEKQTIAMEMAYVQGLLNKPQEIKSLAQLLLQQDIPYRATKVLEKGMSDGVIERETDVLRLLSQAYRMAQEEEAALAPLSQAANQSKDPELYLQLAYAYSNLDRWNDAVDAARKALADEELENRDDAQILLGMALFNLGELADAQQSFRAAAREADGRNKTTARQWIAFIEKERERRAQLAAAGI